MNYAFDFKPVIDGLPALLLGCLGTLWLSLAGMALAIAIGMGGVILRDSHIKALRFVVIGFVELIQKYYDRLDLKFRQQIPLRRVLVPDVAESL